MKTSWNWPKTPSPSSHSSQNSTYIIIFNNKNMFNDFWHASLLFLGKKLYVSYLYHTKWHQLNIDCTMKSLRDDLLERCITSKDAYNSYHYECIEKQTCHTLNKLFIVKCKHKDLASPIQQGKCKSFVGLFKYLFQIIEINYHHSSLVQE
jgi:hypothetical protein